MLNVCLCIEPVTLKQAMIIKEAQSQKMIMKLGLRFQSELLSALPAVHKLKKTSKIHD